MFLHTFVYITLPSSSSPQFSTAAVARQGEQEKETENQDQPRGNNIDAQYQRVNVLRDSKIKTKKSLWITRFYIWIAGHVD